MLSRVAESLYWMSRYIERAENNARIAEVNLQMLLDLTNQQGADPNQQWDPIISSLEENELFASLYPTPDGKAVIDFVSLQKKNPNSIVSCLTRARENARTTSEQISSEMWEQINKLYLFAKSDAAKKLVRASPYEFFKRIITGSRSEPALRTTAAGQSGNTPGIGGKLPTCRFVTRNRAMMAAWFVVIE